MRYLSVRDLFAVPDTPLGRQQYVVAGVLLMALKYGVDAALMYVVAGTVWTPVDYLLALSNLNVSKALRFTAALNLALLCWTLPFLWIGVLLSIRRARDAGLPPWLVFLFFIPLFNYLLMAALALWPSGDPPPRYDPTYDEPRRSNHRGIMAGILAGIVSAVIFVGFGVFLAPAYGLSMFVATPFVIGAVSAYTARTVSPHAETPSAVVLITLGAIGGVFVLIAIEGIGCLVMAAPLAVPIALLGGVVGHHVASDRNIRGSAALLLFLVPAGQTADRILMTAPDREVFTAVEVNARPAEVWRHVVQFKEIRTPPAWYFRGGLAYPLRATIEGSGVGAMRNCEFSTGAFREPITAWEEPSRLAFDVIAQPPPLQEWSPYRNVYAPHLQGFFTTTRGEFRLAELPGGRTRLEGRTWYSLRMQPQAYWTVLSDAIIHRIHLRVLDHIREEVERR